MSTRAPDGSSPEILGKTIRVIAVAATIVGVMPQGMKQLIEERSWAWPAIVAGCRRDGVRVIDKTRTRTVAPAPAQQVARHVETKRASPG